MEGVAGSALRWDVVAAAFAGMVFVAAVASGVRARLARRDEIVERIERVAGPSSSLGEEATGTGADPADAQQAALARLFRPLAWLARPTRSDELAELRASLIRGGLRGKHAMEVFLGVKLAATPVVILGFFAINSNLAQPMVFPSDVGIAFVLAAIAFFFPNLWLRSRIRERQHLIENALPDAMDLLVTCVEAGLGLDAAIARVSDEMALAAPLLALELNHTFLEIQAGVARADGFRRLAERTGVEDLRALSAILIQTDMFGTSIAKALRVHSDTMRVRRGQRAEEKAAMVSVKMTIPLILCILPSLIAIVMGPAVAMIVKNFAGQ